jgi:hypothetical protein
MGPNVDTCTSAGAKILCNLVAWQAYNAAYEAALANCPLAGGLGLTGLVKQAVCRAEKAMPVKAAAHQECLAKMPAGYDDLWDPMQDGVDYALSKGITVVSIAGNNANTHCDIIACGPQDAGEWQVIPCVMDGVICVGAAERTSPFNNVHYFGNRVDLWAPIPARFFGPPDTTAVVSANDQVPNHLGGTSAAAP